MLWGLVDVETLGAYAAIRIKGECAAIDGNMLVATRLIERIDKVLCNGARFVCAKFIDKNEYLTSDRIHSSDMGIKC